MESVKPAYAFFFSEIMHISVQSVSLRSSLGCVAIRLQFGDSRSSVYRRARDTGGFKALDKLKLLRH